MTEDEHLIPNAGIWTGTRPGLGLAARLVVWVVVLCSCPGTAHQLLAEEGAGPAATTSAHEKYLVRAGDVLSVLVWREPDLSGEFKVRLDGMITVPLLGDVSTRGRTPGEIAAEIADGLGRFVELPNVTVGVSQAAGARFFVVGQVGSQGQFPLISQTTVVQALALAGGLGTFAKRDKIVILRSVESPSGQSRSGKVLRVDYEKIQKGETRHNYVLEPGDTILVP